jgi:hypothetical protein
VKALLTSLLFAGVGFMCSTADASSAAVSPTLLSTNLSADNTNNGSYFDILVRNGYVSVYAHDAQSNLNFSCSIWYTNSSFATLKETALAFMNSQPVYQTPTGVSLYAMPIANVTRDAAGTCTEFEFRRMR